MNEGILNFASVPGREGSNDLPMFTEDPSGMDIRSELEVFKSQLETY